MLLKKERNQVIEYSIKMVNAHLTTGTGGNVSIFNRKRKLIAITPSGIDYFKMKPEDVLIMEPDGTIVNGERKPSSESGFHLGLYHHRKDINAVMHTHSVYATTFACLNREIPAVHYLVGFAGKKVPISPYATFGTKKLIDNILGSIKDYNAVLLANHGLVSVGKDLLSSLNVAQEIEFVARLCYQAESIGNPVLLSDDQMDEVIEKFKDYGPVKNE